MLKLIKVLSIFGLGTLMLSGCAPSYSDVKGDFIVPEELKDCTFTKLETRNGTSYLVIRCPNSQVSTNRNGKNGTRVNID